MLKWCIKVSLYQFLISNQTTILKVKSSLLSLRKKHNKKKCLLLQTINKWDLCLKKSKTKWTNTSKCKKMGFSWQKLQSVIRMLFRKKMRVIIRSNKIILIRNNKISKKRTKMMKMNLILEELKWISSRKEQEKF